MLTKKQIEILENNSYKNLVINHTELVYEIKVNKIQPYYENHKAIRISRSIYTEELIKKCCNLCQSMTELHDCFYGASQIVVKKQMYEYYMGDKHYGKERYRKYNYAVIIELIENNNVLTYKEFSRNFPGPYQQAHHLKIKEKLKEYFKEKLYQKYHDKYDVIKQVVTENIFTNMNKILNNEQLEYLQYYPLVRDKLMEDINHIKKEKRKEKVIKKPKKIAINKPKKEKKHLNPIHAKHAIRYTNEEIIDLAKKYHTRKEFSIKHQGAYECVLKRKLIDKAFAHMQKPPESLGEQLVRKAFNYYYKEIFYKIKPEWLRSPLTKRKLELDGYNEDLKIAFEVNGGHHYKEQTFTNYSLDRMITIDKYKLDKCEKIGIKLYVFAYERSLKKLCHDLNKEFNITMEWLESVVFDLRQQLTTKEITKYQKMLKLKPEDKIEEYSDEVFSEFINTLRKQNLSNVKVLQVLKVSPKHLEHRIGKINRKNIPPHPPISPVLFY